MENTNMLNAISEIPSEMLIFLLPIILLQLALTIAALISIAIKEVDLKDKVIWILISVFMSIVGPVIYFMIGIKMLDEKINGEGR